MINPIETISDLIKEIVAKELEILDSLDIVHRPTIGNMYEGLTESVLNKSLFTNLDLRVIKNSFIVGCGTEFDIMLVKGKGKKIPYTNQFQYSPENIIAIIQVKKNLYSKDLKEGYENLKAISAHFSPANAKQFTFDIYSDSFKIVCLKEIPRKENRHTLTINEEQILSALSVDALLPVRILWGYHGFKEELSLRKAMVKFLESNLTTELENIKHGFGPHYFPDLIICGDFSLLKMNGMPFGFPVQQDEYWPFYGSSKFNPTYFFIEKIWTRLTYMFDELDSSIFGEDLTIEPINRFIDCRTSKWSKLIGWEFKYFPTSKKDLNKLDKRVDWQPVYINETQHVIISELCIEHEIDISDEGDLEEFVQSNGYSSKKQFLTELLETNLVFIENKRLKLLTERCQCAVLPDGRFVAAENKTGRLERWVFKMIKERKHEK